MGLVAGGGARGFSCQGRAGDWKPRSRSMQQSGYNRGGAEELTGNSGDGAEELNVIG